MLQSIMVLSDYWNYSELYKLFYKIHIFLDIFA